MFCNKTSWPFKRPFQPGSDHVKRKSVCFDVSDARLCSLFDRQGNSYSGIQTYNVALSVVTCDSVGLLKI